jgi:hypothetical protein
MATTQTRNPTSDISATGDWSGSAGTRYTLIDDFPDSTGDRLTLTGFSGGRISFGFTAFDVPAGSSVQKVEIRYYDQASTASRNRLGSSLNIGSTDYDASSHSALAEVALREDIWSVNPSTGLPWTSTTVNALTNFGFYSTNANPNIDIVSAQIRVTFRPPPPRRGVFLERLLRNTVWDKLTLYDFEDFTAGALDDIVERTGRYLDNGTYTDYRDLEGQTGEKAEVVPFGLNGRNVLRFKSSTATRYVKRRENADTPVIDYRFREAVVVCKADGATFNADRVLISDNSSGATLKGDDTTDDFQTNASTYILNWQTTTGTPAPMGEFGAVNLRRTGYFTFDELGDRMTIGDSFDGTGADWKGDVAEIMFFSDTLTSSERESVKLYNQLKWGLLGMSTPRFPDPTITGIDYARYYEVPADFGEVTYSHTYEDGGISQNESGTPPKRWEVEFTGLDPDEAEIFDVFHELVRLVGKFDFVDPDSVTYENVRVESYERTHAEHRSWINTVRFTLTQYPE